MIKFGVFLQVPERSIYQTFCMHFSEFLLKGLTLKPLMGGQLKGVKIKKRFENMDFILLNQSYILYFRQLRKELKFWLDKQMWFQ